MKEPWRFGEDWLWRFGEFIENFCEIIFYFIFPYNRGKKKEIKRGKKKEKMGREKKEIKLRAEKRNRKKAQKRKPKKEKIFATFPIKIKTEKTQKNPSNNIEWKVLVKK